MEEYKLDEGPLITMYGWVVAVNPLGQMLFSPLLGFISDRVQTPWGKRKPWVQLSDRW